MEDSRQAKKIMKIMWFSFIIIVFFATLFIVHLVTFNHTQRYCDSEQICDDFNITIGPRTGQTDSWTKIIQENDKTVNYKGSIYDVTINNTSNCDISKWNLRIDITQDVFLNNAWCGTFEIHQFVDGKELIQNVDLRNYNENDLILKYTIADPDLLIPLHPGDYLVYYPDFSTNEYPIYHGGADKLKQVVFGAIFYDKNTENIQFNTYHMTYYLQKIYFESPVFWFLCFVFLLWIIAMTAFVCVEINVKKAHIRFIQDEHIIRQSIGVFTQFFEAKDNYTNGHSQRVASYSEMIAKKLDLPEDEIRQIYYIALMHDCGKCYIPDTILKKPDRLTDEEYEIIKSHTVKGAEMLEDFTSIDHIRDGILYHHERYDGTGYPTGLQGDDIPLVARIICIADSFDAMNSRRCYRDMLDKDYIISELKRNKGKQFDPNLTELFLNLIQDGKINFLINNNF